MTRSPRRRCATQGQSSCCGRSGSVVSRWVRSEATLADRNRTLVPAMIEACERPIMFELTQTPELAHWQGAPEDKAWQSFLADVRRFVAQEDAAVQARLAPAAAAPSSRSGERGDAPSLAVAAVHQSLGPRRRRSIRHRHGGGRDRRAVAGSVRPCDLQRRHRGAPQGGHHRSARDRAPTRRALHPRGQRASHRRPVCG